MKKFIMAVGLMLACAGIGFAQTAPAKKEAPKKVAQTAPAKKDAPAAAPDKKAAAPTKKDGTPDMRYKANKAAADTTKHMKKNGTPDKRYKENKKKG